MDRAIREKWAAALRSGKYEQGTEQLRSTYTHPESEIDMYCCLGVLCDIIQPEGWEVDHVTGNGQVHCFRDLFATEDETANEPFKMQSCFFVPETLAQRLGLERHQMDILTAMNDDDGADFHTIADYIEENL